MLIWMEIRFLTLKNSCKWWPLRYVVTEVNFETILSKARKPDVFVCFRVMIQNWNMHSASLIRTETDIFLEASWKKRLPIWERTSVTMRLNSWSRRLIQVLILQGTKALRALQGTMLWLWKKCTFYIYANSPQYIVILKWYVVIIWHILLTFQTRMEKSIIRNL